MRKFVLAAAALLTVYYLYKWLVEFDPLDDNFQLFYEKGG